MQGRGLTPTRITDRNGRATTVYRRAAAPAAVPAPLAAARPTVAAAAPSGPRDHETVVIKLEAHSYSWLRVLLRADPRAPHPTGADVTLSFADAYRYLAMGLPLKEAGLFHSSVPDPGHWERLPGAIKCGEDHLSVCQSGSANGEGVAEAVAFMRGAGTSPESIEQMILNGFSDSHVRGVLDAEQLQAVFLRMKYGRSTTAGETTRSARMLDRVIDGSLPFGAIERGYRKNVLCDAADFLFAPGRDEVRQAMLADSETLVAAMGVMDVHTRRSRIGVSLQYAWDACRMFGEDVASRYPLGLIVRPDLDAEGRRAIAEALEDGYPAEQAAQLLTDESLTGAQALAAITGATEASLAAGWL